ncbi:MAG: hypothetical protein ACLTDM_00285 [Clostridium butyricum]
MAIIYRKYPKCNSRNVIPIVYGMPTYEGFLKAERKEILLGGCCLQTDTNGRIVGGEYYCKDCKNRYDREDVINEEYSKIQGIKGCIGGYFGGYKTFEIDFINKKVYFGTSVYEVDKKLIKKIYDKDIREFIEKLKQVNLLNWKKKYINNDILDGTQWNIIINVNGRKRDNYGSNSYPKEWEMFCELISRFIGRKFK